MQLRTKLLFPRCHLVSKENRKMKRKKKWTGKLYIAADVHTSLDYYDFFWSKKLSVVLLRVSHDRISV